MKIILPPTMRPSALFWSAIFSCEAPQEQSLQAATSSTGPIEGKYPSRGSRNTSANVERSHGQFSETSWRMLSERKMSNFVFKGTNWQLMP